MSFFPRSSLLAWPEVDAHVAESMKENERQPLTVQFAPFLRRTGAGNKTILYDFLRPYCMQRSGP